MPLTDVPSGCKALVWFVNRKVLYCCVITEDHNCPTSPAGVKYHLNSPMANFLLQVLIVPDMV